MLDAYIIEEEKKRKERVKQEKERPRVYDQPPMPPHDNPSGRVEPEDDESNRGIIKIGPNGEETIL